MSERQPRLWLPGTSHVGGPVQTPLARDCETSKGKGGGHGQRLTGTGATCWPRGDQPHLLPAGGRAQAGPEWQTALALSLVRAVIHIVRSFLHSQISTICVPQRALFLVEQAIKMARVPQKMQLWKAGAENQVPNQG